MEHFYKVGENVRSRSRDETREKSPHELLQLVLLESFPVKYSFSFVTWSSDGRLVSNGDIRCVTAALLWY